VDIISIKENYKKLSNSCVPERRKKDRETGKISKIGFFFRQREDFFSQRYQIVATGMK
jgi:hypothetical protein